MQQGSGNMIFFGTCFSYRLPNRKEGRYRAREGDAGSRLSGSVRAAPAPPPPALERRSGFHPLLANSSPREPGEGGWERNWLGASSQNDKQTSESCTHTCMHGVRVFSPSQPRGTPRHLMSASALCAPTDNAAPATTHTSNLRLLYRDESLASNPRWVPCSKDPSLE